MLAFHVVEAGYSTRISSEFLLTEPGQPEKCLPLLSGKDDQRQRLELVVFGLRLKHLDQLTLGFVPPLALQVVGVDLAACRRISS
jgi:hypothetical protein